MAWEIKQGPWLQFTKWLFKMSKKIWIFRAVQEIFNARLFNKAFGKSLYLWGNLSYSGP
jgi:hypothetical protein